MLNHIARGQPPSQSLQALKAAHERIKLTVARAFGMPDNLFNDHDDRDHQLSRRFFNRRSEGGSGIVDISVTAAPAFLASKLDVLRYFQGDNLYWLTDMEKDSTQWSQSQSPTLREASDILGNITRHAIDLHISSG